jgi:hypothetical protein
MIKGVFLISIIGFILLTGCNRMEEKRGSDGDRNQIQEQAFTPKELQQINEVNEFTTINGYKVEEGMFYFSGVKANQWKFYALNLDTKEVGEKHREIGIMDVFIPLEGKSAIFVDVDGQLFYRREDKDQMIDDEVFGEYSPNLLMSPDLKGVLYTKGPKEDAHVYCYMLDENKPRLIKENISRETFETFPHATHWSNTSKYFILNNSHLYDNRGNFYTSLEGTSAKWSPNDEYIAFIQKPADLKERKIIIGDWVTSIGTQMKLFTIKNQKNEIIYENKEGLIDVIDSIQWSKDSSRVGISIGKIEASPQGELDFVNYEKIAVYYVPEKKLVEIKNIPYNYYEFLFNTYVYGSTLGNREVLEIMEIEGKERKLYEQPALLNSKDMFVISNEEEAYLINGTDLIKLNPKGQEEMIIEFPWKISEMYYDSQTKNLIIINEQMNLFLLKR